jgi:hypothetical protein
LPCLAAIFAVRCGFAPTVVLNPKYQDLKLTGRTLAIFPPIEVSIENKDDFDEDLGRGRPIPPDSMGDVAGRLFMEGVTDRSLSVRPVYISKLDTTALNLRDTSMLTPDGKGGIRPERFIFPDLRRKDSPSSEWDLGLQLCRVRFYRGKRIGSESLIFGGGKYATATNVRSGKQFLGLDGFFVLWDYKLNVPVAYGKFSEEERFLFAMTRREWSSALADAAGFILMNTPVRFSESRNPWEKAAHGSSAP